MRDDLSQMSLDELFQAEAETQVGVLTAGLLALERRPDAAEELEACMRAAHSLKGAARIVGAEKAVVLAHALEDLFVAAQRGAAILDEGTIDLLLEAVDLIPVVAASAADEAQAGRVEAMVAELGAMLRGPSSAAVAAVEPSRGVVKAAAPALPTVVTPERSSRVTVENLNRLVGLAGEALVEARQLQSLAQGFARLRGLQRKTAQALELLAAAVARGEAGEVLAATASETHRRMRDCEVFLSERLADLDTAEQRNTRSANRLYDQALACRMQPFADGTAGLPRMTRDLARSLGKQARLVIEGAGTQVDRDILARLEAPLAHLVRNAVDHGLETPAERQACGKPAEGVVRIQGYHSGGFLQIVVSDDGRGVDLGRLRQAVVARGLAPLDTVERLGDDELLDFLFLPGFTLKREVSEISGRGVGLDAVRDMLKQVRGQVRVTTQPGGGVRFQLQLPLTLSFVRALVVEVAGEAYALPLAHVDRVVQIAPADIQSLQGRQHFAFDGRQVGLVSARDVLGGESTPASEALSVVVVGDGRSLYGLAVDRLVGGTELVVQPLDPRLGKLRDISAAALTADGEIVLIIDIEDLTRSIERLVEDDRLARVDDGAAATEPARKRVLVVDDSLTVRELERKLLDHHGYEVQVAVDGMDAWSCLRGASFDLVVTDVDMPRMDGIELVELIRRDPQLKSTPVVILSYKDREDDRRRGLEAGADYYLTKSSFQNDGLLNAVVDLIGKPA